MPSWPESTKYISHATIRVDGASKASGRARYSSDIQADGWLYGMILRSKWPVAEISEINLDKALQIPGAGVFDFVGGWMRILFQQRRHAHDEPRCAITALQRVPVNERPLDLRQFPVLGQPFNCSNLVTLRLDGEFLAGINRLVVEQDGASPASSAVAAFLGAGQAGIIAQRVEQRDTRLQLELEDFAVDLERNGHRAGANHFFGIDLFQFLRHGGGLRGHRRDGRGPQSFKKCPAGKGTRAGCFRLIHKLIKWSLIAFS